MLGVVATELLIILVLVIANGFFSGSELAIVSARRSRLEQAARGDRRGARQALTLAENPDRFLATVQVGISLIGTFAAAFGGARISAIATTWLLTIPALAPYAEALALIGVVLLITYLSLVVGELVPKRIALQHAETWAMFAAPPMTLLARFTRPVVALLTLSVGIVLRVLGQHRSVESPVTEEDILYMAQAGASSGTVEANEAQLIRRVFRFTDRPVNEMMTSRPEIVAANVQTPLPALIALFGRSGFSRLPIYEGSLDHSLGTLQAKDLLRLSADAPPAAVRALLQPPIFVFERQHADDVLNLLRTKGSEVALVVDEHGQIEGLVTLKDLLEELVGGFAAEAGAIDPEFVERADGSWLVDGRAVYDRVRERIDLPAPSTETHGDYTTLAGMILSVLGRIPAVGDRLALGSWELEVVDMDGRRIDRMLISRLPEHGNADLPQQ
ncbi:MAG: hemolysin family protein [Chloroflexota bacterium]|nr:hemolysin family protein [Chloroflexota bacterium]